MSQSAVGVSLVVGLSLFVSCSRSSTPSITKGTSSSTSVRPNLSSPDSYWTKDGSKPSLFPSCNGLFGLCLASPIEAARSAFGLETKRFAGAKPGSITLEWDLADGLRFIADADNVGTITRLTVTLGSLTSRVRVALPGHLVMGQIHMGDVTVSRGIPMRTEDTNGENEWFYTYVYYSGGEGSEHLRFTVASFGAPLTAEQVPNQLVTSFNVSYN